MVLGSPMLSQHTTQLHPSYLFVIIFIHVFSVYFWGGYTCEPQCMYIEVRTIWESWLFPSTMWDPEFKLRSSSLGSKHLYLLNYLASSQFCILEIGSLSSSFPKWLWTHYIYIYISCRPWICNFPASTWVAGITCLYHKAWLIHQLKRNNSLQFIHASKYSRESKINRLFFFWLKKKQNNKRGLGM